MFILGGSSHNLHSWFPATYKRDLGCVPGFWLWPRPATPVANIWGVNQHLRAHPPSFSNKLTNKKTFFKRLYPLTSQSFPIDLLIKWLDIIIFLFLLRLLKTSLWAWRYAKVSYDTSAAIQTMFGGFGFARNHISTVKISSRVLLVDIIKENSQSSVCMGFCLFLIYSIPSLGLQELSFLTLIPCQVIQYVAMLTPSWQESPVPLLQPKSSEKKAKILRQLLGKLCFPLSRVPHDFLTIWPCCVSTFRSFSLHTHNGTKQTQGFHYILHLTPEPSTLQQTRFLGLNFQKSYKWSWSRKHPVAERAFSNRWKNRPRQENTFVPPASQSKDFHQQPSDPQGLGECD